MKIDQLIYFLETARLEHVGKASKTLSISRSAISHSISLLEEELGQKLFEKRGRNIFLTQSGKALQSRTQQWLNELEKIKNEIATPGATLNGHYRFGASHLLASNLLLPAWHRLTKNEEDISSEIYSLRSSDVLSKVGSGELDFGICFSPQTRVDIEATELYRGQMNIYVGKKHPVLNNKTPYKNLHQYSHCLPKAFSGIDVCETHPMIKKFNIKSKLRIAFDNYDVALRCLEKSNAWSLIPEWVVENTPCRLVSISPKSGWNAPYSIEMVTRKMQTLPYAVELLKQELLTLTF